MLLAHDKYGATPLDYIPNEIHQEWCMFLSDFVPMFIKMCPDGGHMLPVEEPPGVVLPTEAKYNPDAMLEQVFASQGQPPKYWSVLPKYWNQGMILNRKDLESYTTELVNAVGSNDLLKLQMLIGQGSSVNAHNLYGHSVSLLQYFVLVAIAPFKPNNTKVFNTCAIADFAFSCKAGQC
jgi:hypothetical protein